MRDDERILLLTSVLKTNIHAHRTVALGKLGSFPASAIIGKPYGLTYEIVSTSNASPAKGKDAVTLVVKDDLPITNIGEFFLLSLKIRV